MNTPYDCVSTHHSPIKATCVPQAVADGRSGTGGTQIKEEILPKQKPPKADMCCQKGREPIRGLDWSDSFNFTMKIIICTTHTTL